MIERCLVVIHSSVNVDEPFLNSVPYFVSHFDGLPLGPLPTLSAYPQVMELWSY
jgi:hypothetical protein